MSMELKMVDWLWSIAIGWVGYMHYQLKDKPSRDEIELRQLVNDERHKEIKEDLQRLENKIDKLLSK
jgi:NADH:ubiquinone oxidoreductase subunit